MAANGEWWLAKSNSNGTAFVNERWGKWSAAVAWTDLMTGDFNGDGRTDLVGRVAANGEWWVARSNDAGTAFVNERWGRWSAGVGWVDVMAGDFNGDGRTDLIGRVAANGEWWVARSNDAGTGFINERWGKWSAAVEWTDLMTGDFNGDGRSDLVGRVAANGEWWVARSTGTGFTNERWGKWSTAVTWAPVLVGNFAPAAAALHAARAPAPDSDLPTPISQSALAPIVEGAILRLGPELDAVAFQVQIVDLPGLMLGYTVGTTIYLDHNAAGFGWYVNPTDADFEPGGRLGERTARPGMEAVHRIDLLTTVLHELGHLLGYSHAEHGLMQPALGPGIRRVPVARDDTAWTDLLDEDPLEADRLDAYFAAIG